MVFLAQAGGGLRGGDGVVQRAQFVDEAEFFRLSAGVNAALASDCSLSTSILRPFAALPVNWSYMSSISFCMTALSESENGVVRLITPLFLPRCRSSW